MNIYSGEFYYRKVKYSSETFARRNFSQCFSPGRNNET